jgi:hypothetical protein
MVELSSHVLTSNRTLLAEEIECYREKSTEIEEGENFQSKIEFVVSSYVNKTFNDETSCVCRHLCFVLFWFGLYKRILKTLST